MSVFTRLAIFYFILLSAALIYAWQVFYEDIKPSFRQISEEAMIDNANLMAELMLPLLEQQQPDFSVFDQRVKSYQQRNPQALIWSHLKADTNTQFYLTDARGEVIYHSLDPTQVGEDYSQWRDVFRTLQGEYGARTSLRDPEDPDSGEMYVAAPIRKDDTLLGVFTLIKPHQSIVSFIGEAEFKLTAAGLALLGLLTLSGLALVIWYRRMLEQLIVFVDRVRRGQKAKQPNFQEHGFGQLSEALQNMRAELDGKLYVENYTHTLTHELKSPLAAISAATELLQSDLPEQKRAQFMGNIEAEVLRMQQIIEQLLLLASLENRQSSELERIELKTLIEDALAAVRTRLDQKKINLNTERLQLAGLGLDGDSFLLATALSNLLGNAIDFCPAGGIIEVASRQSKPHASQRYVELTISNTGAHIPDYAKRRLFERFFSTARADSKRKSSGLGLCVVEQVCELHGGSVSLSNIELRGQSAVQAFVVLPLSYGASGLSMK
ncbi:MAG: two-component system sensor histidine kinase CreC [Granulosicoccaceae bacterium]